MRKFRKSHRCRRDYPVQQTITAINSFYGQILTTDSWRDPWIQETPLGQLRGNSIAGVRSRRRLLNERGILAQHSRTEGLRPGGDGLGCGCHHWGQTRRSGDHALHFPIVIFCSWVVIQKDENGGHPVAPLFWGCGYESDKTGHQIPAIVSRKPVDIITIKPTIGMLISRPVHRNSGWSAFCWKVDFSKIAASCTGVHVFLGILLCT